MLSSAVNLRENSLVFVRSLAAEDPEIKSGTEEHNNGGIPSINFPR